MKRIWDEGYKLLLLFAVSCLPFWALLLLASGGNLWKSSVVTAGLTAILIIWLLLDHYVISRNPDITVAILAVSVVWIVVGYLVVYKELFPQIWDSWHYDPWYCAVPPIIVSLLLIIVLIRTTLNIISYTKQKLGKSAK